MENLIISFLRDNLDRGSGLACVADGQNLDVELEPLGPGYRAVVTLEPGSHLNLEFTRHCRDRISWWRRFRDSGYATVEFDGGTVIRLNTGLERLAVLELRAKPAN